MVHVSSFRKLLYLVAHNRRRVQVSIVLRTELCFMGIDTILKWGTVKTVCKVRKKLFTIMILSTLSLFFGMLNLSLINIQQSANIINFFGEVSY